MGIVSPRLVKSRRLSDMPERPARIEADIHRNNKEATSSVDSWLSLRFLRLIESS
jgi:hypothetical protein